MCVGDFNDVVSEMEKKGGRRKEKKKIECFQEMINSCGLNDAHYKGQKFTWYRIRKGELIKERLDRALVNLEWMEVFPNMQIMNLAAMGFDHSLLVANSEYKDKRKFKFEVSWLMMEDCEKVIKEGWSRRVKGSKVEKVVKKLGTCRNRLGRWSKENVPNNRKK